MSSRARVTQATPLHVLLRVARLSAGDRAAVRETFTFLAHAAAVAHLAMKYNTARVAGVPHRSTEGATLFLSGLVDEFSAIADATK